MGGLLFGAIMAAAGVLPLVASLVGSDDAAVGFLVHMGFSGFIGGTFGILVAWVRTRPSRSLAYGIAYGAVWWVLGGLTLMPLFLGMRVAYDTALTADGLGGLAGHLIYGVGLGATYGVLETRAATKAPAEAKAPSP